MPLTTYSYTVDDTANDRVVATVLHEEIQEEPTITIALERVDVLGDAEAPLTAIDVVMRDPLTAPEQSALAAVIAAHLGIDPDEPAISVEVTGGALADLNLDAFARLRISDPYALFDSKQVDDDHQLIAWAEKTVGVGSSIAYNQNRASRLLEAGGTAGDLAIRQTRSRWNYQPGRSFLVLWTFAKHQPITGAVKESGYFDDSNGLFLRATGSVVSWVRRSFVSGAVAEEVVPQSAWNFDKLDGTGPSGLTLDMTKAQIAFLQFEWLGVGAVGAGFFIGGKPIIAHCFRHANVIDAVYMSNPNLFVRYRVEQLGASATVPQLEAICSAVYSEGGQDPFFIPRGFNTGRSSRTLSNNNPRLLFQMRRKVGRRGAILPQEISVMSTADDNFAWFLVWNGGVTALTSPVWRAMASSITEIDFNENGNVNPGMDQQVILAQGHASRRGNVAVGNLASVPLLGEDVDGNRDRLTLFGQRLGNSNVSIVSGLNWHEVI